jgi:hypothetical protein
MSIAMSPSWHEFQTCVAAQLGPLTGDETWRSMSLGGQSGLECALCRWLRSNEWVVVVVCEWLGQLRLRPTLYSRDETFWNMTIAQCDKRTACHGVVTSVNCYNLGNIAYCVRFWKETTEERLRRSVTTLVWKWRQFGCVKKWLRRTADVKGECRTIRCRDVDTLHTTSVG